MMLMLETLYASRDQSFLSASCCDKDATLACSDAEVTSPETTSRDTSRDYFSQIRQLRQQL